MCLSSSNDDLRKVVAVNPSWRSACHVKANRERFDDLFERSVSFILALLQRAIDLLATVSQQQWQRQARSLVEDVGGRKSQKFWKA